MSETLHAFSFQDGFTTFCLRLGHVKNQRQRTPANRKCLRCIVTSLIFLVSLNWLMSFMFMPYAPSIQYDLLKVSNRLSSLRFPTLRWLKNCLWNSRLQCSDCVLSNPSYPEEIWELHSWCVLLQSFRCFHTNQIAKVHGDAGNRGNEAKHLWHKNLPLLCGWKWTYSYGSLQSWAIG